MNKLQVADNVAEIRRYASRFRNALEQADLSSWSTLADFPRGSCGDASLLLGRYLRDVGLGDFQYVCGEISPAAHFRTHAWLQSGQLIVDITADQFDDVDSAVVVTYNHTWHDRFNSEIKHVAGWEHYDDQTRSSLDAAYETVLSTIGGEVLEASGGSVKCKE